MSIKERYLELLKPHECDDEIYDFIERGMQNISDYVQTVYRMEMLTPIVTLSCDGEEVRDRISKLDSERRIAHEAAIAAVKKLNRWATANNLPKLFEGDENNRQEVANFCAECVKEFFDERIVRRK